MQLVFKSVKKVQFYHLLLLLPCVCSWLTFWYLCFQPEVLPLVYLVWQVCQHWIPCFCLSGYALLLCSFWSCAGYDLGFLFSALWVRFVAFLRKCQLIIQLRFPPVSHFSLTAFKIISFRLSTFWPWCVWLLLCGYSLMYVHSHLVSQSWLWWSQESSSSLSLSLLLPVKVLLALLFCLLLLVSRELWEPSSLVSTIIPTVFNKILRRAILDPLF